MMFIIVDLPEPDVPMIAIDEPCSIDEIDAAQRVDEVVAHHVRALDAAHLDQGASHQNAPILRVGPALSPWISVISWSPGSRSPSIIWVVEPSVRPGLTSTIFGLPSTSLPHRLLVAELHAAAPPDAPLAAIPDDGIIAEPPPGRPARARAARWPLPPTGLRRTSRVSAII